MKTTLKTTIKRPEGGEVETVAGLKVVWRSSAIVVNDITKCQRDGDARFKILIVDACRELATVRNANGEAGRSFNKMEASGMTILQSRQTQEFSCEDSEFDGVILTYCFLAGLNGAADGVSLFDVCGCVSRMTRECAPKLLKELRQFLEELVIRQL